MTNPSRITGTLVMEDRGARSDGRHNVMVFGVLAMSPEDAKAYCRDRPIQQWVQGSAAAGLLRLGIAEDHTLEPGGPTDENDRDMRPYYRNCTVDQLLTYPIWRV